MRRKLAVVEVKKLHPSSILPKREHDPEISDSVRKHGVQQPIIVRPLLESEDEYEIIDGLGRIKPLDGDAKLVVDVRYNLKDVDVFKISETTFKRNDRTTYEKAFFYRSWVDAVIKETGIERGTQKRVAEEANLSQAEVSHYLSINRLFKTLRSQNIPERNFNGLKNQWVNKLYALARVEDNAAMLEVAAKMAEKPDMPLEELKALIREQTSPERAVERLLEEDEEEEESEDTKIDRLKKATQELEGALDKARKVLTGFTTVISGNPRRFLAPEVLKRIRSMLNTLRRIEREANRIVGTSKKTGRSDKQAGVQ